MNAVEEGAARERKQRLLKAYELIVQDVAERLAEVEQERAELYSQRHHAMQQAGRLRRELQAANESAAKVAAMGAAG